MKPSIADLALHSMSLGVFSSPEFSPGPSLLDAVISLFFAEIRLDPHEVRAYSARS
jgi:hypothetical protein